MGDKFLSHETVLRSEHLVLRPIETADVKELHAIFTDPQVRKFLWDDEVISVETTRDIVETSRGRFEESDFGIWGIRRIDEDALTGFAGYWHFREPPALELLFGLSPAHWGSGCATEGSRLVLRHGFQRLAFERVVASTDVANDASVRVMERLGMSFDRKETVEGLDTVFYTISKEAFDAATSERERSFR